MSDLHYLDNLTLESSPGNFVYRDRGQPLVVAELVIGQGTGTTTLRLSKLDLESAAGPIEGRIGDFGNVRRELSDGEGMPAADRIEITINDTDLIWHRLADPDGEMRLLGGRMVLKLGYAEQPYDLFYTVADYLIDNFEFSRRRLRLSAQDVSRAYLQRLPPVVQNDDPADSRGYFPNAPAVSLGRTIPIVYGVKLSSTLSQPSTRWGPIEMIRIDGSTTGYGETLVSTATFTVAAHPMTADCGSAGVIAVYEDDGATVVELASGAYSAATVASTATCGANNTLVTVTRSGSTSDEILTNCFYADVGGRSNENASFTNPIDALVDILTNEALDASGESMPYDAIKLEVARQQAAELGLKINYAVTEPLTVAQWLTDICRTFGLAGGFDSDGSYYVQFMLPALDQAEHCPSFSDEQDMVAGSLTLYPAGELFTVMPYRFEAVERVGEFRRRVVIGDDAAAADYGARLPSSNWDLRATDDANSASYCARSKLADHSRPYIALSCRLPLTAAGLLPGDYVKFSCREGLSSDTFVAGYRDRAFRVLSKSIDLDHLTVEIEAADVHQYFYGAFYLAPQDVAESWVDADTDERRYGYLCDTDGKFPDGNLGKHL